MSWLGPSLYFAVALNWAVAPGASCEGPEMTISVRSRDGPEGESHPHQTVAQMITRRTLDEVRMAPPLAESP